MDAFDTCVLARYLVPDDPVQTPIATDRVRNGGFIPTTVLLELAWLLGSRYRFGREQLAATLIDLLDLPGISVVDEAGLKWAIEAFRSGADIADMIHLTASHPCSAFVTFDVMTSAALTPPLPIEVLTA